MKIAVVHPAPIPLAVGGAERLWWGFVDHVNRETEHECELIKLPSPERSVDEVLASYDRWAQLDVGEYDAVVVGKYPAWMVEHPNKRVYLQHPLRGLYDSWPADFRTHVEDPDAATSELLTLLEQRPSDRDALLEVLERLRAIRAGGLSAEQSYFPGPFVRLVVRWLDSVGLRPEGVAQFVAQSRTVVERPDYFPAGAHVRVAYPMTGLPVRDAGKDEGFFFTVSRLDGPKRIDLLVRAMVQSSAKAELRIAGTGPQEQALRELAGGDPRIRFLGRVGDDEVADLYARARAVLFAPQDEDFGLVALEAMRAGKPVVTTTDSGGPTELVQHGRSGFVVPPEPAALAEVLERLAAKPRDARRMGEEARRAVAPISWKSMFDALFAP